MVKKNIKTVHELFEISTMDKSGRWIRIFGKLIDDNRQEVHKAVLDDYPNLRASYTEGDPNTNTLYLDIEQATIYSFTEGLVVLV